MGTILFSGGNEWAQFLIIILDLLYMYGSMSTIFDLKGMSTIIEMIIVDW